MTIISRELFKLISATFSHKTLMLLPKKGQPSLAIRANQEHKHYIWTSPEQPPFYFSEILLFRWGSQSKWLLERWTHWVSLLSPDTSNIFIQENRQFNWCHGNIDGLWYQGRRQKTKGFVKVTFLWVSWNLTHAAYWKVLKGLILVLFQSNWNFSLYFSLTCSWRLAQPHAGNLLSATILLICNEILFQTAGDIGQSISYRVKI